MAAIDRNNTAGHEPAALGCQQQQSAVQILERSGTPHRNTADDLLPSLALQKVPVQISLKISRRDSVHPNVVPRQLQRQDLCHLHQRRLADRIARRAAYGAQPRYRGNVNDRPTDLPGDKASADRLRYSPGCILIQRKNLCCFRWGSVEKRRGRGGPRVIDKDRRAARRLFQSFDAGVDSFGIGDVHFQNNCRPTLGLNRLGDGHQLICPPRRQSDDTPCRRQGFCEVFAETRGRARHKGNLIFQIEEFVCIHDTILARRARRGKGRKTSLMLNEHSAHFPAKGSLMAASIASTMTKLTGLPPKRKGWQGYAIFAGRLFAVYLIGFALLFAGQRYFLYHNGSERLVPAERSVPEMVEQTVPSDGVDVVVWTYDAGPSKPVIVYFHGNASVLGHRASRFRWMIDQGWGVVGVGLRGGSGTGGSPSEEGHAADARAVYDALPRLLERRIERGGVVLYGESLGSGIAVTLANERGVGAVILETPYAAIEDLAQEKFPFFPIKAVGAMRDPFRSIDRIKGISAPVFMMHGTEDAVIPMHHAQRLFDGAENPKWYRWFDGGRHHDLWQRGAPAAIMEFMNEIYGAARSG